MYKFEPALVFSGASGDVDRLAGLVDYVKSTWKESRAPKIGALAYEASTSRQADDPRLYAYAKSKGVEWLPFEFYPFTSTDFSTELNRIVNERKADYVFLRGGASQVGAIMKDVVRLGLKDKAKYVVTYFALEPVVGEIAGIDSTAGILGENSNAAMPVEKDLPGVKMAMEIQAKYRKTPVSCLSLSGFMLAMVAHESMKRTVEAVGPEKVGGRAIADQVWKLKDFDTGGLAPPITLEKGNISLCNYLRIVQWQKNGDIVPITKWQKLPWFVGNPATPLPK